MDMQVLVEAVQKDVPEPLDSTILRSAAHTCQHFFRETETWRMSKKYDTNGLTLDINDVPNTYVHAVRSCYITDETGWRYKLKATSVESILGYEQNLPEYFALEDSSLHFDGHTTGSIELIKVLVPTHGIKEVPDSLSLKWFDILRVGTLSRVLAIPSQTWTDVKLASVYDTMYATEVRHAKRDISNDRNRVSRRVKFNPDFRW